MSLSSTFKTDKAILLINTGSPSTLKVRDVRSYLREFLMDERVIDLPYWKRFFLVNAIIAPFRAKKSAAMYRKIWTKKGSPLLSISKDLAEKLAVKTKYNVKAAMRYGQPSIVAMLDEFKKLQIREVFVIPMFPHYAMSTFESVEMAVRKMEGDYSSIRFMYKAPYFIDEDFILSWKKQLSNYIKKSYDHVLFSYHSIPVRHLTKTDPSGSHCMVKENCCEVNSEAVLTCYKSQLIQTTKAIAKVCKVTENKHSISFQSAMGTDWLNPSTKSELTRLAASGVKKLILVAPGFVADNLETLEELSIRARRVFLSAGGKEFTFVPSLNTNDTWLNCLIKWTKSEFEKKG